MASGKRTSIKGCNRDHVVRKTRRRYEHPQHLRYLTFSCYHHLPLFSNDAIKQEFVEQLRLIRLRQRVKVIAWVIMPEHVHLMIQLGASGHDVPSFLHSLKRPVAQRVLTRWRNMHATTVIDKLTNSCGTVQFWQAGGGYDRNIVSDEERLEKIQYIHQNPVRRGLVSRTSEWKWSSAGWYAGRREDALVPIDLVT